jgi:uncharacterized protein (TIGR00730 family)
MPGTINTFSAEDDVTDEKAPSAVGATAATDEIAPKDSTPSPYRDFRSGASWRVFRIMAEFIEGFEFLADLKNEVTFFGSARCTSANQYYKEARKLAQMLGRDGFTIITGGGGGIMEAGNRGATEVGAVSVGLNIQLPMEQRINRYVRKARAFNYFFTRKVMLSISAQAYVYFPGGFGTMDEFLEIVTLVQTRKMAPIPIVLLGRQFWTGFYEWVKTAMLADGYISEADLELVHIVDTAEEAYQIIRVTKERQYP